MPLTGTEAQALHEAGAKFASAAADLRAAENDRITAELFGRPLNEPLMRDIENKRTTWRKAHTRFHGLIDDLKEETP